MEVYMQKFNAKQFISISIIIAAAMTSAGCGDGGRSNAYLTEVPEQMEYVYGLQSSAFCIPDGYSDFIPVTEPENMTILNGGYHLTTGNTDAYVALDYGLYSETYLDKTYNDAEELVNTMELASNIRISNLMEIAYYHNKYRDMSKGIYSADFEALYNDTFFADYHGYIGMIAKDGKTMLYCAGSPAGYEEMDLNAAKSLMYNEYSAKYNAGKTGNSRLKLTETNGGINTWVKADFYYRGSNTQKVTFGIKLESIKRADTNELDLSETPLKGHSLPNLPNGYEYRLAVFDIDTQGYDISNDFPDIRIRQADENGKQLNENAQTYWISTVNKEIRLLCVAKKNETTHFLVGTNQSFITAA